MSSLFCQRFETTRDGAAHEVLLIFSHRPSLNVDQIADILERNIEHHLMPDEIVIGVPDPTFLELKQTLIDDPIANTTWRRLNARTVVALSSFGPNGEDLRWAQISGPDTSQTTLLSSLMRRGITSIFKQHDGFVHANENYHFVNPSGRHTEKFIRLSNILADSAQIGFMAYCCLPHTMGDFRTAYIDTPSLYAIMSAMNDIRSIFSFPPLEIENFRSYEGLKRLKPDDEFSSMVLISASSSGGLAKKLQEELGFPGQNLIHLLYLGNMQCPYPVVCDLVADAAANPEGFDVAPRVYEATACPSCRSGSFQVHLHGDQFDVRGPQPRPLIIRAADAPDNLSKTIGRLAGVGALSVRAGSVSRPRDRAINIDVAPLFQKREFSDRLSYVLRRAIPSGTTHIICVDDDSKELCERVAEHIRATGGQSIILPAANLDPIAEHARPSVVVVAAVIESGRCLTDISRDLRSVAGEAPIIYIVGIEKTNGLPRREALKRTLIQTIHPVPHDFIVVEKFVLPVSEARNSWNDELDLLRDPSAFKGASEALLFYFKRRVRLLEEFSKPLKDELFLPNSEDARLSLQPGFVFWPADLPTLPHSQADVFFTIASVLQQLRANAHGSAGKSAIRSAWFHQTVLDPSNFGRFNDDIIQASILRAASPGELNYRETPIESRELARIICRVVKACGSPRGGAAAEFMLALATGRLKLGRDDTRAVIEASEGATELVQALGKMVVSGNRAG